MSFNWSERIRNQTVSKPLQSRLIACSGGIKAL